MRAAATVTNDIFTREDQEFLIRNKALPAARILAIETGGCPHAAIREDISANMGALETLQAKYACQLLFVESGGDNLAANYSRELADYIIYVIDVSVRVFSLRRLSAAGCRLTWLHYDRAATKSRARAVLVFHSPICLSSTRSTLRPTSARPLKSWIAIPSSCAATVRPFSLACAKARASTTSLASSSRHGDQRGALGRPNRWATTSESI